MPMNFGQFVALYPKGWEYNPFTKDETSELMDLFKKQNPKTDDSHNVILLDDGFQIVKEFRTKDHDQVYVVGDKVFCEHEDGLIYEDKTTPLLDAYNIIAPDLPKMRGSIVSSVGLDLGLRLKTVGSIFEVYKALKQYRQMVLCE